MVNFSLPIISFVCENNSCLGTVEVLKMQVLPFRFHPEMEVGREQHTTVRVKRKADTIDHHADQGTTLFSQR